MIQNNRYIKESILLVISLLLVSSAHAQIPKNQVEGGLAFSVKLGAIKAALNLKKDVSVEGSSVAVFSYEYRLHERFALGASYTQQSLSGSYTFQTTVNGNTVDEDLYFDYSRKAFVLEPKFYYPINLKGLEIYSSLRLGIKNEKVDAETTNTTLNEILKLTDLIVGNPINLSLTPVGINYFPSRHIGIGITGNLGPTYLTKLSAYVRF